MLIKNKILALTAIYRGSQFIDRQEFNAFASILLENDNAIQALQWVPIVEIDDRINYERLAQSEGLEGFEFTEKSPDNTLVSVSPRSTYYPI